MENKGIIELQDDELNEVNGGQVLNADALYVQTNKYSNFVPEEERIPVDVLIRRDRISKEFRATHPILGRAAGWPIVGIFIGYIVGDMNK